MELKCILVCRCFVNFSGDAVLYFVALWYSDPPNVPLYLASGGEVFWLTSTEIILALMGDV